MDPIAPEAGGGGGAGRPRADLPPELLEKVARAMPGGDRLWFRLVCRSWAAAEAAFAVRDAALWKKFKRCLCHYAAEGGHLAVLRWARAHGCPWDELTCAYAAEFGHLEVLQ